MQAERAMSRSNYIEEKDEDEAERTKSGEAGSRTEQEKENDIEARGSQGGDENEKSEEEWCRLQERVTALSSVSPSLAYPTINAIGPGTVAMTSIAILLGPAAWTGTVQVIETATTAGAVVIDTVGAEATRTVQETASVVRACLRLGVIGGSSIAALACASRLWTRQGMCPRRADTLAVAAVRQQSGSSRVSGSL